MILNDRPRLQVCLAFLATALLLLPFSDIAVYPAEPWQELGRILLGIVTPHWQSAPELAWAILHTFAFALVGVAISAVLGLLLSLVFNFRLIRVICASTRAVHEIFWALIFMQVFGLSTITGILAIAIPYTGIFAKVFFEILEQQPKTPRLTVHPSTNNLSAWLYAIFCQALPQLRSYIRYRFECALRSSAILGFIGLPTLGFYFETAFSQGNYSEAACLLWCFYLLIASLRWWLNWRLIPAYIVVAILVLPDSAFANSNYFWQFVSKDIWPREILHGEWRAAGTWYWSTFTTTVLPALAYTIALSLLAMVLSGILALAWFPLATRAIAGRMQFLGHGFLLMVRSTPEFVLAFVLLLLFGPSALPAILALAVHNGGLIGYLLARNADTFQLRQDSPKGLNLVNYELIPRSFAAFMALLLYRWEVIMRESAILGLLGITTLGFYIDSAFEEIRYDKAFFLVLMTAALNIVVDSFSRKLQRYCELQNSPSCLQSV